MKNEELAQSIRQRIANGELRPGDRLGTRAELVPRFGTCRATLQHAVNALVEEGFLVTRGRSGTLVAPYPPHRHRFGLVLPMVTDRLAPGDTLLSRLESVGKERGETGECRLEFFRANTAAAGDPGLARLAGEIERHMLAGVIVLPGAGTAWLRILESANVPVVVIASTQWHPCFRAVDTDYASFLERSVSHLVSCGKLRLGLVTNVHLGEDMVRCFENAVDRAGGETHPHWLQGVSLAPEARPWIRRQIRLLMHGPPEQRPNGLVLANGNVLEALCAGIADAGVQVPHDLHVVSHCNFPAATVPSVQVTLIGFDVHRMLDTCLAILQDPTAPAVTRIAAVTEDEFRTARLEDKWETPTP